MALISKARYNQKEKLKIEISSDSLKKIHDYCKWSQIEDIGFFIEEAACFVFSKDREWKEFQKKMKKASKSKSAS